MTTMESRLNADTYVEFVCTYMGTADYRVYPRNGHSYRVHVRYLPVDDYERSIRNPSAPVEREREVGEYWGPRDTEIPRCVIEWIENRTGLSLFTYHEAA